MIGFKHPLLLLLFWTFIPLQCTVKWKWWCVGLISCLCKHTKKFLFGMSIHIGLPLLIIYHLRVLCELSCWLIYLLISVVGVEICNTQFRSYSSSNCFSQAGRPPCFLGLGQFWGILFTLLLWIPPPQNFF